MADETASNEMAGFQTWVALARHRAATAPDREAFTFLPDGEGAGVRWDHRHLDTRARAVAARLQQACKPGDRALLLFQPGPEFIAAFHGCLYAGVIAVPAYPPRSAEHERALPRLAGILRDASPSVVLTAGAKMLDTVSECVAAAAPTGATRPPACVNTESFDDASADAWRELADLSADTVAFLQYTSGSTAAPKGVVLTHGNLLANSAAIRDAFGHHPGSRGVIWLPPYHDMGLIGGILQPIFAGFPVTLMPPAAFLQKPLRWLKAVSDWRATTSGGPDFAFDLCLRSIKPADRAALDLSTWDLAFTGAEPVRQATLDRFAEAFTPAGFRRSAFYPCYGLAEATLLVTGVAKGSDTCSIRVNGEALRGNQVVPMTTPILRSPGTPGVGRGEGVRQSRAGEPADAPFAGATRIHPSPLPEYREREQGAHLVACGSPCGNVEICIVDPQTLAPAAPDRVGEIWVRGSSIARGYWNQPDATQETFGTRLAGECDPDPRPWLRTGDLGFLAGGRLYVTGRLKDLIIVRGRNHYPHDLEQTAGACHPALRPGNGAAFGVELDGHERVVIVHELERSQRDADPALVFDAVLEAIATRHELQTHAIVLLKPGRLPRTSSGKVRRRTCRDAFVTNEDLGELARWTAPPAAVPAAPVACAPAPTPAEHSDVRTDAGASAAGVRRLEQWLLAKLAAAVGVPAEEIDPAEPFARYGLDSIAAVGLACELEAELNLDLEATLFWDYPTVRSLAEYLAAPADPEDPTARAA